MSEAKHCEDIFLFQKTLQKLRDIDDKIIYALNLSTPTKSFQVGLTAHSSVYFCQATVFQNLTMFLTTIQPSTVQARGADPAERCVDLQQELRQSHESRGKLVTSCLEHARDQLRTMNENGEDKAKIRAKQNILRGLESEIMIEDIIRERTSRAFREKCSEFL